MRQNRRLAAFNIILFRSHGQGRRSLAPRLVCYRRTIGFPVIGMCKLEAEKFSKETGIPCPYAESADETHAKITQIMRKKLAMSR